MSIFRRNFFPQIHFLLGLRPQIPKNFLAGILYMIPSKNVIFGLQKPDILHHEIRYSVVISYNTTHTIFLCI